jgi:phosphomannomutase/phosphoglucomutase
MKSLAKLMGNPSIAVLVIFLSCLAIVAGFLWQNQYISKQHQQVITQKQSHIAGIIHSAIENKIAGYNKQIAAVAESPQLATIIARQDPRLIASQQRALMRLFPQASQVCLIEASVDEPDPDACIPITFATLNSLRLAKKEGSAPVAIMQTTQEDAYLLLTQSIKDNNNKVMGILAITMPAKVVQKLLLPEFSTEGYIELQQGANTISAIASQGDKQWRQGQPLLNQPLAKSHWRLAYWPAEAAKSSAYLVVLGIVLSLVLLMWLFRERSHRFVLLHDLDVLKNQLTDLSNSQLKATYPTVIPEMVTITDEIKRLGQTLPIIPKVKKGEANKPQVESGNAESDSAVKSSEIKPESNELEFSLPVENSLEIQPLDVVDKEAPIDIVPSIFKAYDIRGIVGETINKQVVRTIGQAIGSEALDKDQSRLVVGRDGRLSSSDLSEALIEGIIASGCEVVDIGQVPTPLVYFACEHLNTHSGVMVTGSHNPANYNGLKITIAGKPVFGASLQQLYQRVLQGNLRSGQGSVSSAYVIDDYIAQVKGDIHLTRPLKVVVDCGNGVAGVVVPQLLTALGCEVIELYCEVDGSFPNHHPNPSEPANLQDLILAVRRSGAELGIAFDGDGDRLGTVDAEGNIIWADRLMIMFAQDVLSRLPGSLVIYDVKSSSLLEDAILGAGGEALMWQSGYAVIRNKMQETGAPLAGELSGHIFFNDRWYGFDDAMYSACRLLELLARDPLERNSTQIFAAIPNRESTPEIMVDMAELECHKFIQQFVAEASFQGAKISTIDGLRADFPSGWGLVRASNTVPGLTLRFEAETQESLQEIQQQFKQQMLQVKPTITLLF